MTIDWHNFTPWTSLAGGAVLGLSAALFVLLNGRIAGISGVLGGLLRPRAGDLAWRVAFVGGLLVAPLVALARLAGLLPGRVARGADPGEHRNAVLERKPRPALRAERGIVCQANRRAAGRTGEDGLDRGKVLLHRSARRAAGTRRRGKWWAV